MAQITIIIPTYNHAQTLPYSVRSVLQQTYSDFEIWIIGDGATPQTHRVAQKLTYIDSRVQYFPFPKSARTGEEYRHQLLKNCHSRYVCYLSDDDLWLPYHLEQMRLLLKKNDFAYTFPIQISPNGTVDTWYGDLHLPFYKKWLLQPNNNRYNFIPLSAAGHTLKRYRKLPFGWRSTPHGKHTDLYMWQQFLADPSLKTARSSLPSMLHFASSLRTAQSQKNRQKEIARWYKKLTQPGLPNYLTQELLQTVYNNNLEIQQSIRTTKTFQLHQWVKNLVKLGRLSK